MRVLTIFLIENFSPNNKQQIESNNNILWFFGGSLDKGEREGGKKSKRYQDIIFSFFTPKASYNNLSKYNGKLKNNVLNIESFPFVEKLVLETKSHQKRLRKV